MLRRVVDHPEVVHRLAGEIDEEVDRQPERNRDAALDPLGRLDGLVEVLLPGGAELGCGGELVGSVQRRPGDDLGMIGAVLATAVDRLLEIAGKRVGVVERLGGDADVATVAPRPADGDRLLLLGRLGEEQPQLLEHPFLDPRSIPWPVTSRNPISRKISSMRAAALAAAAVSCSMPVAKAATSTTGSDGVVTSRILRAARDQPVREHHVSERPAGRSTRDGAVGARCGRRARAAGREDRWGGRMRLGLGVRLVGASVYARGPHRSGRVGHDGSIRGRRDSGRPRHARRDQRPVLEPADVRRRPSLEDEGLISELAYTELVPKAMPSGRSAATPRTAST